MRTPKINSADWISIVRLISVPGVIAFTLIGKQTAAGWILGVALCTDMVDGMLVRYLQLSTKHGVMLDTVADGAILFTAIFSVVWFHPDFTYSHLPVISLVMGVYFFQSAFAFIKYGRLAGFHKYSAKAAAIAQGIFFVVSLLFFPIDWLFYIAIMLGLLAEAEEILLITLLPEPKENVKGIYWALKERQKRSAVEIR